MMFSLIQHKLRPIFFVACLLLAGVSVHAQTIPEPTGNAVNDFANVIDAATEQRLEQTLINLKRQQKIEFAVATVKTTGEQEIFDYTLAVGRKWGVGAPEGDKEGLLLLVAVDDRKYFTLVSRHLQGELPDGLVGSIERQYLVPAFRAGDYGKGVTDTIRAYIERLGEERGFSTADIYPQDATTTQPRSQQPVRRPGGNLSGTTMCCIIIIVILLLLAFSRGRGGGGGCLNLLLLGSMFSGGGRSWGSSWGSGGGWGSGGWSGGGGGGFGGFGGGGDFDGGGAGGSW